MTRIGTFGLAILGALLLVLGAAQTASAGAGTVKVKRSGKEITITGDNEDNCISVFKENGDLLVVGCDGTTVTGSPVSIEGVKRYVVKTQGGNDSLRISIIDCPDSKWTVETKDGDDDVDIEAVNVKKIEIDTGDGNDWVGFFGNLGVSQRSEVDGGKGDDQVDIFAPIDGPTDIKDFEFINGGGSGIPNQY